MGWILCWRKVMPLFISTINEVPAIYTYSWNQKTIIKTNSWRYWQKSWLKWRFKSLKPNEPWQSGSRLFPGESPRRIDFVKVISCASFDDSIKNSTHFSLEDRQLPVIHYNYLILSKSTTRKRTIKMTLKS